MLRTPAITLPTHAADGLPVGIQLVGRAGDDAALAQVAANFPAVRRLMTPVLESQGRRAKEGFRKKYGR